MGKLVKVPQVVMPNVVATATVGILEELLRTQQAWVSCETCRCLCAPDEVCPGCRARRLTT